MQSWSGNVATRQVIVMSESGIIKSIVVPAHPHPYLVPEQNEGWGRLREAFDSAREEIENSDADLLIIYSTLWPSIIGHQIQADPNPEWVFVDHDFHDIGSIPYSFEIDSGFAEAWDEANRKRGLQSRTVSYHGFPIDGGSVVALKLLNPENRIPAVICSSNIYSNRSETTVLAKACLDAVKEQGRKAIAIVVMSLSNRMFTEPIDAADDKIHSLKDDEWNSKVLEFLGDGRLEDVAQLSRNIHSQIRVQKVVSFKPMWWLSAMNGQHNNFTGRVLAYEALHGAGGGVVILEPSESGIGDKEYDEDDVEFYQGDRSVLDSMMAETIAEEEVQTEPEESSEDIETSLLMTLAKEQQSETGPELWEPTEGEGQLSTEKAPKPVGPYPHARRVGDLLYLSGVGPRQAGSNEIPGGPIKDEEGAVLDYDIEAQTKACIENVKMILETSGSSLDNVLDVTSFLIDMDRDFQGYNKVYGEYFSQIGATRTTLAVRALPTPIAVELKVIAKA